MVIRATRPGAQPSSSSRRTTSSSATSTACSADAGTKRTSGPWPPRACMRGGGERGEGAVDLARVAQAVVEHERHQGDRWRTEAPEHPLVLVGEDVEPALLLVAQGLQHRAPPRLGEVLRLVDHHGVVALAVGQVGGELPHEPRQLDLPELAVGPVALGCAPLAAEVVEGADEGGLVPPRPGGHHALEVGGQAEGVAEQRHPLGGATVAPAAEVLGLLQRQHGLARPRTAAHLDTAQQPGDARIVACCSVSRSAAASRSAASALTSHAVASRRPVRASTIASTSSASGGRWVSPVEALARSRVSRDDVRARSVGVVQGHVRAARARGSRRGSSASRA